MNVSEPASTWFLFSAYSEREFMDAAFYRLALVRYQNESST